MTVCLWNIIVNSFTINNYGTRKKKRWMTTAHLDKQGLISEKCNSKYIRYNINKTIHDGHWTIRYW